MIDLDADMIVDVATVQRCPFGDGLGVIFTGESEDEETGIVYALYRCPGGHTWYKPALLPLLRLAVTGSAADPRS